MPGGLATIGNLSFIKIWGQCHSVTEVMKRTGLTRRWVQKKAKRLREKGVNLPHFERVKAVDHPMTIERLNRLFLKVRAERERGEHDREVIAGGVAKGE